MPEPTKEDAKLYVKLLGISQASPHVEARRWVFADFNCATYAEMEAKHPKGSVEREHLINVMGFFEATGVLVSRGLLHEDVFYDAPFAFESLWAKVKPIIPEWQKAAGAEAAWENVQWLGERWERWHADRWKPKLEAIPTDRAPDKAEPAIRGFQH